MLLMIDDMMVFIIFSMFFWILCLILDFFLFISFVFLNF